MMMYYVMEKSKTCKGHREHSSRKLQFKIEVVRRASVRKLLDTWIMSAPGRGKVWCSGPVRRATQDGRVMVESSDKTWSTGEGNSKPLQYSCLESPINSMKRLKDRTLTDELPRSVGARHATGDQWRNNSRKNEETEPKQKQHPVVDVTGDGSQVQCCKEQYCIGSWNVRSMNQGKLEVVKQEMARDCQHSRKHQIKMEWNG